MKNILTLCLALLSVVAFGQTEKTKEIKKEVKIENTDGKYKVTLVTTENGETKTITKTYDSLDEIKDDPDMGDVKMMSSDESNGNFMFFSDKSSDLDGDIKVIVKTDKDGELHTDHDIDSNHTFVFKSGDSDADMHKIKVWVDEDGKKHISKDGVEVEGNTWTSEDGETYDIKKLDGKVMFLTEDKTGEFITEDGKHIDVKVSVDGDEKDVEQKVIIITTDSEGIEGDAENVEKIVIKITEEIKIHLAEIEENEFTNMPGIDAKALKLNDLNYYPNPNSGKFTLAFEGNGKPTEIKITGIDGKEVYTEQLQTLEGNYNKEIDLTGQEPGVYLLQILQGKRAMNKKIVIE